MAGNFEQRDNTGALFKNERKTKDSQPDYTGTFTYKGEQKQLAAWLKTSGSGKKYLSLAISDMREPEPGKQIENSDDIPF